MSDTATRTERDVTLRVHRRAYDWLTEAAHRAGMPLTRYLDEVAEREHRRMQWARFREAAEQVQRDPAALAEEAAYDRSLEGTLADGLEPAEPRQVWDAIFAAMANEDELKPPQAGRRRKRAET